MLLKELSEASGVSGGEGEVREIIKKAVEPLVDELKTDVLGNLIAFKKGAKENPRVMLSAHMDEVGLIVAGFEKSGLISFSKVGGIDDRVLVSKPVLVGEKKIPGVIGAKAIHLQKPEERKKSIKSDELYIDIGAKDKEEAEKKVKLGDYVSYNTRYQEIGVNYAKGKAFDNRVGCSILIEALKRNYSFPLYGVFTVQEEIGMRGAAVTAYSIKPDLALVLEGTTAADVIELKEENYVTTLGKGPALTFMDASVICDKRILETLTGLAEDKGIPVQFRRFTGAYTDAGMISLSREGVRSVVISVPCRYIHNPVNILSLEDVENTLKLVELFLDKLPEGGVC
ncbi:MAG: M42 family peptidase [Candidatus Syntrophonatronum acetioxidans]|uniref:M42 family peptidase n=1 Tax=Candidatus Syntrophonatronum acetioxidans TaxID=1795816 RepID=A0A424YHK4_9FIRM|nr:MAG: M42 family peptidase [Candidatus Syntrophonatronum acetioxidans]